MFSENQSFSCGCLMTTIEPAFKPQALYDQIRTTTAKHSLKNVRCHLKHVCTIRVGLKETQKLSNI